jgi:hypothetical protein
MSLITRGLVFTALFALLHIAPAAPERAVVRSHGLLTYALPCASGSTARNPFAPHAAHAGHGEGEALTRWRGPQREDAAPGASRTLGTAGLADGPYCKAHYLVAPGVGSPSIDIAGAYRARGESRWTPFAIRSTLAWGAMVDLPAPTPAGAGQLRVTLTRDAAAAFDGIDFTTKTQTNDDRARQLLRALTGRATLAIDATQAPTRPNNTYHD